jgi:hypothetical protein
MGLSKSRGFFGRQLLSFVVCFCSAVSRFDCGTVSPSRPRLRIAPRAAAVKAGRRPPPEAARSGLDGGEHGARLFGSGGAIGVDRCRSDQKRSSPAAAELSVPQQPCIRYEPLSGVGDHDAVMRIDGEAPKGGPILQAAAQGPWAEAGHRHLGSSSATSRPKADARRIGLSPGCLHRACLSLKLSRRSEPDEASCPPAPCRW